MRFLFICLPIFLSAWWSIIFTECNDEENKISYKKNKELYISDIKSSVNHIKIILEEYKNTVINLLPNDNNKNILKKEMDAEIKKLNSFFTMFNIDFDFINPLYNEGNRKFTHISMQCPTDSLAKFNTAARQEQVLITNKITICIWVLSYILQLKNNMASYILDTKEKEKFGTNFYNEIIKPLSKEIKPLISNFYEEGKEGNKNIDGEEKSFFDLPIITFNFIDKNKFVIDFYNNHVKKKNINKDEIINTNIKLQENKIDDDNNEEIKGLLWRIGKNKK